MTALRKNDIQQELTADLISIIHHFSMKLYSNRRKLLKSMNNELKNLDKDYENN